MFEGPDVEFIRPYGVVVFAFLYCLLNSGGCVGV